MIRFAVKAILAAALVWSAAWFAAAWIIERHGNALVARSDLLTAQPGPVAGFPLSFQTTAHNVDWRSRDGRSGWQADEITLQAASFQPNRLHMQFSDQQQIRLAGLTSRLQSADMAADATLRADLTLATARMTLNDARLEPPLFVDRSGLAELSLEHIEGGTYALSIRAHTLGLAAPVLEALDPDQTLPDHLDELRLDAALQFSAAIPAQGPLPQLISLHMKDAQLDWGALNLGLDGQISRSDTGALDGQMALSLQDWRPFHAMLVATGALPPDAAMMAGLFLAAQTQSGSHAVTLPLDLRDSMLSLGPFPLVRLPLF